MGEANAHYYATRDPLGAAGDFTTAPEISQIFGELIGLALADLWDRAGRPPARYVELGPGRGTLAADALRAMARVGFAPAVHLVETSPALRSAQSRRLPDAIWHEAIDTLPAEGALLVVANEFFDALPIRQLIRAGGGWCERMVEPRGHGFAAVPGDRVADPPPFDAAEGTIVERPPAARAIMHTLSRRIAEQGGTILAFDYGHAVPAPHAIPTGETLQAVRAHAPADPFADPGERDLSAHVDFAALAAAARAGGLVSSRVVPQGEWLIALDAPGRAAALARAAPTRADEIGAAYRRLVDPAEMGQLFKLLACTAPGWPAPAGCAAAL